jgi:hypothetical protein
MYRDVTCKPPDETPAQPPKGRYSSFRMSANRCEVSGTLYGEPQTARAGECFYGILQRSFVTPSDYAVG